LALEAVIGYNAVAYKKQVYGKKKITPMSSIKNCDVGVGLPPMYTFSASSIVHGFLRLILYMTLHCCGGRSVWPAQSIQLLRQTKSRLNKAITGRVNMYKKLKGK
jgi:hypothetical protein